MKKIDLEEQKETTKVSESSGVVTPEAKDAGFHEFPEASKGSKVNFSLPKLSFKKFGIIGGVLLGLVLLLIVLVGVPGFAVYKSAKQLQVSGNELQSAASEQNLDKIKTSLSKVKGDLSSIDKNLGRLSWVGVVPYFGNYVKDANNMSDGAVAGIEAGELILKAVEPYADILGFGGGAQATDGAKTAEDRISFIVDTIEGIVPQLDEISKKTNVMEDHFGKVDPNRYPESFRGHKVREPLKKSLELVTQVNELVTTGKPVLEQAPYLLGVKGERTYLFLWQNDKELRPTGGFLTAYSIVKVKNGKFQPGVSNDIYSLDAKLNSRIPAPEPIKKYLPLVPYWNIRDMNLSPDFKISMDTFKENYDKTKSPQVDGIISMDTKLVVDILAAIGGIGVPGFGNFSADDDPRCNCPVVIYELESFADVAGPIIWANDLGGKIIYKPPNSDNRKAILGPLMNSILSNAMGQPKEKLPGLFTAGFNALLEKHVMFYFGESEVQKAMESFNLAGRIKDYDGDYLHINDANFAGAKANLYVQEEVDLKVEPGNDGSTNTLTIKYKNPQKHDGWLNGPYRDWFRVYVPKGSQLIDSTGSEVPVSTSEDLGKTVFDGFFTLKPLGVLEIKLKYKTPIKSKGYKILIQKQPGTDGYIYTTQIGKNKEEFIFKTDKEIKN